MLSQISLRALSSIWVVIALSVGLLVSAIWFYSVRAWQDHLNQAYSVGVETFYNLETGKTVNGIGLARLAGTDLENAELGLFERISGAPRPSYITLLSMTDEIDRPIGSSSIKIAVVSDRLQYKVADIVSDLYEAPGLKFGDLAKLLATYCSNPMIYAKLKNSGWIQIDGLSVWGCDAAPNDLRLLAVSIAIVTIVVLVTQIGNTTEAFDSFSKKLKTRNIVGGPDSYEASGPRELFEIVKSVNSYLEFERSQLSKRAIVLSGVSHDLGTPATRLRLRAALIKDPEIREKLEADIDQMTGIIGSVLTFTRSELNSELPRKISLASLVQALVEDYQDTNQPVALIESLPIEAKAERSIFASRSGSIAIAETSKILMYARPVALRRAVSNLIDNALKYGRRATVSVSFDANWAIVIVEDEGGGSTASDMERLLEPFERGENTHNITGYGLGLTIVATVANQHGGKVEFEDGQTCVRAKLFLRRSV